MREIKFNFATMEVASNALLCPNPIEFYSKAYLTEDIADNFRVIPGIKYKTKIANVLFSDILQASDCPWAATAHVLDGIDIDVCGVSAMAQICQFDIEKSFLATTMAPGSNATFEVQPFMNYYWDEMASQIGEEIEILRWQGDTGLTSSVKYCDGYLTKFGDDSSIVDVSATASITISNVIGEITKVVQALVASAPGLVNKRGDLRLFLDPTTSLTYQLAAASGNTIAFVTESLGLKFLGIKIVEAQGLPTNTMVLTSKDNLIYAIDGANDATNLKAINLAETTNEPILRTRADIKIGFYYTNPTEIVLYS